MKLKKSLDGLPRIAYLPYAIELMEDRAMKSMDVTAEQVRHLFEYAPAADDPARPLVWKNPGSNAVKPGTRAGRQNTQNGRWQIGIGYKQYYIHQLVWLHKTGETPKGYIRQRDGNYSHNWFENLFEATASATNFDRSYTKANKTGFRGVSWNKLKEKFQAKIKLNGRDFHLGYFETAEAAHEARIEAEARIPKDITPEQFAFLGNEIKAHRWRRTLWDRLLIENEGKVGWASFDAFAVDIGIPQSPNHRVMKVQESEQIGPSNWQILPPLTDSYDLTNVEDQRAYGRERRRLKPHLERNNNLKANYGVDLAWVQRKLIEQDGVCAICRKPETQMTKGGKLKSLVVDHDHKIGAVRALLCHSCNSMLGYATDSIDILEAAIAYLRRHAAQEDAA